MNFHSLHPILYRFTKKKKNVVTCGLIFHQKYVVLLWLAKISVYPNLRREDLVLAAKYEDFP